MDDLAIRRRVFVTRERKNNGKNPYHSFEDSKQEIKKNKFFKEKKVSKKERHICLGEKGMSNP